MQRGIQRWIGKGFIFGGVFFTVIALGSLPASAARKIKVTEAFALEEAAGCITFTPKGDLIASLHPFYYPKAKVIRITKKGERSLFPNERWNQSQQNGYYLDSVLGVQSDDDELVWMVDNGLRSEITPKLVAWNIKENTLHRIIHLPKPITTDRSLLSNLAIDPEEPYIYISDPAEGEEAAIIEVDTTTGQARRLFQGHFSLLAENLDLVLEGQPLSAQRLDGSLVRVRIGVTPITIDKKGRWLYFGPMHGRTLYRIALADVRNPSLSSLELVSRIEGYARKGICSNISLDSKGNVYLNDLQSRTVSIIREKDRKYLRYLQEPEIDWPQGLAFGEDGRLYVGTAKLHRSPYFNNGINEARPPFPIWRFRARDSGTTGR